MQLVFPQDAFPYWPKDILSTFDPLFKGDVIINGGYHLKNAEEVITNKEAEINYFKYL